MREHYRKEPLASRPQAPPSYAFGRGSAPLLPWSHARRRLETARYYWLATVRPDGRPHVTPVWGVWVDEALYFDGPPTTHWARNLRANPALSVHLDDGNNVVILEGRAEDLTTDAELGDRIVAAWDTKYGRLHPDPSGSGILRLRPRSARAWSDESLVDGTRWQFAD
ncbi:MAG TPA: pyridoxamine 5'-phosphate oxidase family protein [Chloroflexota bacterium]|nr:pyridoxamine 5'-phosphate oxidase family protein [Chloroflexota bacterium]